MTEPGLCFPGLDIKIAALFELDLYSECFKQCMDEMFTIALQQRINLSLFFYRLINMLKLMLVVVMLF